MIITAGMLRAPSGEHAVSVRTADDWLISVLFDGGISWHIADVQMCTTPPSVVLLAPQTPYAVRATDPTRVWHTSWARFTPGPRIQPMLRIKTDLPYHHLELTDAELRDEIFELMPRIAQLAASPQAHHMTLAENLLERVILLISPWMPEVNQPTLDPKVAAAIRFIHNHYATAMHVEDMADEAGCSVSRLGHLFKEQTGQTPNGYLENLRLETARQLLTDTGLTVTEVANEVGYSNAFYFSARFRRRYGLPPSATRPNVSPQRSIHDPKIE